MCGRIFQTHAIQTLLRLAKTNKMKNAYNFNPTYNMGPTNYIPAIRAVENEDEWDEQEASDNQQEQQFSQKEEEPLQQEEPEQQEEKKSKVKRGLDFMKWGYQTSFSLIINARVEEMHDKHTFKPLLNTKRCVVMADGYYEWNPKKEPFVFQRKDKKQILMAAMYTDNNEVFVLTRDAFGDYEKVHHRMPVLLEEDEVDLWINTKNSFHEIIDRKILNQQKKIWGEVDHYRCAPHVNSIKEKSEKCLLSLEDYKNQLYQKGLGRFFQKKPKEQDTPQQLQQTSKKPPNEDDEFNVA